jgi:hypothetical protein
VLLEYLSECAPSISEFLQVADFTSLIHNVPQQQSLLQQSSQLKPQEPGQTTPAREVLPQRGPCHYFSEIKHLAFALRTEGVGEIWYEDQDCNLFLILRTVYTTC